MDGHCQCRPMVTQWGAEAAPPAAGDHGHLWPHDWLAMPAMSHRVSKLAALAPSLSDSFRTHISIFLRLRFSIDVTSTVIPQVQSSSSTIGKGPKGGQTNLAASRGLQRLGSELHHNHNHCYYHPLVLIPLSPYALHTCCSLKPATNKFTVEKTAYPYHD